MTKRYRVGFPDPATQSWVTDRNPGMPPIVDTQSFGALGVVIAVCDNIEDAEWIVDLLNTHPRQR